MRFAKLVTNPDREGSAMELLRAVLSSFVVAAPFGKPELVAEGFKQATASPEGGGR